MFGFKRLDRHADLFGRMAETVGIDLAEEMQRGELPPQELRAGVLRCSGCRDVGACETWLEAHQAGADAPPGYCRNVDMLAALGKA